MPMSAIRSGLIEKPSVKMMYKYPVCSGCHTTIKVNRDTIKDFKFCPYCGKPIEEVEEI